MINDPLLPGHKHTTGNNQENSERMTSESI